MSKLIVTNFNWRYVQWVLENYEYYQFVSLPDFERDCGIGTENGRRKFFYSMRGILFTRGNGSAFCDVVTAEINKKWDVFWKGLPGTKRLRTWYIFSYDALTVAEIQKQLRKFDPDIR